MASIGIPVYNEERFIRSTLNSAISQSFKDLEVIVVDNHSDDSTFEIAREVTDGSKRARIVRNAQNIGPLENFKRCLELASGKYFAWLGGHDLFNTDYIELAIQHLENHSKAVMVYPSKAVFVNTNNVSTGKLACSNIAQTGTDSPAERVLYTIHNLILCSNIHGVFRTEVLRRLPWEKILGPDYLQLVVASLYGEIHEIPIEGIRRREVREENPSERLKRWKEAGLLEEDNESRVVRRRISVISRCVFKSCELSLIPRFLLFLRVRKLLVRRHAERLRSLRIEKRHCVVRKALGDPSRTRGLILLLLSIIRDPVSVSCRPTLGALLRVLRLREHAE